MISSDRIVVPTKTSYHKSIKKARVFLAKSTFLDDFIRLFYVINWQTREGKYFRNPFSDGTHSILQPFDQFQFPVKIENISHFGLSVQLIRFRTFRFPVSSGFQGLLFPQPSPDPRPGSLMIISYERHARKQRIVKAAGITAKNSAEKP